MPPEVAAARFEATVVTTADAEMTPELVEIETIEELAPPPASDPLASIVADDVADEPATGDDVEPAAADADVIEPEAVEPEPEVVEPEVEPEVVEPEVVEPGSEVAESEVAEPEVVEPADVEPEFQVDEIVALVEAAALAQGDEADGLDASAVPPAVRMRGVTKSFGATVAVDEIELSIPAGTFYGIVGPNGAGKTTTLSMIAGLLRPDEGSIEIAGIDLAADSRRAKQQMGILPDRLRTFDRLTGRQLLHYYGVLRGLRSSVVESRSAELARAFDLADALSRPVSDYSAGMTKKIMLAGAMIHSPRVLVLDEPFESVDPVSSAVVLDILSAYVSHGGTVILSSHGMELVERVCSGLAVIVGGRVLAEGSLDEVRGDRTLEERFIELAGGIGDVEGLEWLHTFSD